ncbi:ATP-binding protein [Kitasatospora sp. DSM 101779]|uniref:ATP-binding protein n=1 Tax=Kitasatospora sp. DSM 101779 TaxID=2853165 RepID=UPI0021D8E677|nr:ATP-binding protein [Kitasatospora sp. DSM 101779]MCU7826589.1 ATP-binding protein [Kitasatospora sp. DSM 101779]
MTIALGGGGRTRAGRRFAEATLVHWGVDPAGLAADNVRLVVAELLANAAQHAGGPIEMTLSLFGADVRIEVVDAGPGLPRSRRPHDAARPSGHGLFIVERLSSSWGVMEHPAGKAVWAVLALSQADGFEK